MSTDTEVTKTVERKTIDKEPTPMEEPVSVKNSLRLSGGELDLSAALNEGSFSFDNDSVGDEGILRQIEDDDFAFESDEDSDGDRDVVADAMSLLKKMNFPNSSSGDKEKVQTKRQTKTKKKKKGTTEMQPTTDGDI